MKIIVTLIGLLLLHISGQAQQHPLFTQYMFNMLAVNPGYAGSTGSPTFTASIRRQWTGFPGAPQTEVISGHAPLPLTRSSLGFILMHDKVVVNNQYLFQAAYAYRIPLSAKASFALGVQSGISQYRRKYGDLDIISQNPSADPAFAGDQYEQIVPTLGLGAYFHTERSYLGISMPTVIDHSVPDGETSGQDLHARHYFISAGHVIPLGADLKFKPNVLARWKENGPFQIDLNANFLIREILWLGVSYRSRDSIDGLVQWILNDQLSAGYSYGMPLSSLSNQQNGTHEFVLSYRLRTNKNVILTPRYF